MSLHPAFQTSCSRLLTAATLAMVLATPAGHATDLGTIGPTSAITEPHLLRMIEQRLREKERTCLLYTSRCV